MHKIFTQIHIGLRQNSATFHYGLSASALTACSANEENVYLMSIGEHLGTVKKITWYYLILIFLETFSSLKEGV